MGDGIEYGVCLLDKRANPTIEGELMKHLVVYKQSGQFCGWPANAGIWAWGDEVHVGFTLRQYEAKTDRHSVNLDAPPAQVFARSKDLVSGGAGNIQYTY